MNQEQFDQLPLSTRMTAVSYARWERNIALWAGDLCYAEDTAFCSDCPGMDGETVCCREDEDGGILAGIDDEWADLNAERKGLQVHIERFGNKDAYEFARANLTELLKIYADESLR